MTPLLARLLVLRGIRDPAAARHFLDGGLSGLPRPAHLSDMDAAAARLADACEAGQRVCVHGDYDVDGVVSTALTVDLLRRFGARAEPSLPHRLNDGYGISADQVSRYADAGYDLLVCCDCGVTAHAALERARERELDVLVLDHHRLDGALPPAVAVVDPERDGTPHGPLCAAGVSFMVMIALRAQLRERGRFDGASAPNLGRYLDLVALATVADMVPLVDANRLLVRHGLTVLGRRQRIGLRELLDVAGVAQDEPVDAATCGFRLGPRINAAGRLDDPMLALELVLSDDATDARRLAMDLDQLNRRRRILEDRVLDEALAQVTACGGPAGRRGLAVMGEGWHPGVLGIVASRLGKRFHRPTVALSLADGLATGSARSIPGVDVVAAIRRAGDLLERCGGHAAAAGLSLRGDRFEAFRERFEGELFADEPEEPWTPTLAVDAELPLDRVNLALAHELQRLAPFGSGNREPLFVAHDTEVRGVRAVRRGAVQMRLGPAPGQPAIAFRLRLPAQRIDRRVDVVFAVTARRYRGEESVQVRVEDLRNAQ